MEATDFTLVCLLAQAVLTIIPLNKHSINEYPAHSEQFRFWISFVILTTVDDMFETVSSACCRRMGSNCENRMTPVLSRCSSQTCRTWRCTWGAMGDGCCLCQTSSTLTFCPQSWTMSGPLMIRTIITLWDMTGEETFLSKCPPISSIWYCNILFLCLCVYICVCVCVTAQGKCWTGTMRSGMWLKENQCAHLLRPYPPLEHSPNKRSSSLEILS